MQRFRDGRGKLRILIVSRREQNSQSNAGGRKMPHAYTWQTVAPKHDAPCSTRPSLVYKNYTSEVKGQEAEVSSHQR